MEVMPLYTYYCNVCDKDLEVISSIEKRDTQKCDSCGYSLIRNIDRPGLVWAPTRGGSGFAT
jgi:putative FmdB family regulatory protein